VANRLITVELIGLSPEVYKLCLTGRRPDRLNNDKDYFEDASSTYPNAIVGDQKRLWTLYHQLTGDFNDCVRVIPLKPASLRAAWLTWRHGLKEVPAVIVDGKRVVLALLPYDDIKRIIREELEKSELGSRKMVS